MNTLDIINLIDKNSITRLSKDYDNKLINKIKTSFTDTQQQIFVASFYCYLNYDTEKDFVIEFDNVWKWLGYTRKDNAKTCLEKHFVVDVDYKIIKAAPVTSGAAFEDIEKAAPATSGAVSKPTSPDTKNIGGAGKNKERLLLSVNTFKKFCMKANTKKADEIHEYYIKLEKLLQETMNEQTDELRLQLCYKDEVLATKDKQIETLQIDLEQEQKDVIKTKKSLMQTQSRFSQRYKFPENSCVYILQDPDCKYNKLKIGLTTNINTRLASDRTMIPCVKVRCIMYTDHCELFEKIIKIKCKDTLELPSHEWVFEELDDLLQIYKDIDKACGFSSIIETNLWRYNLEKSPTEEYQEPEPVNIPTYYGKLTPKLYQFLPTYLIRHDYLVKNKNAPQGQRWCNGWCQCYKIVTDFTKRSESAMTICLKCENMIDIAEIRVQDGTMTEKQVRKNPSNILLGADGILCRKCNIIKHKDKFQDKKRQCEECRLSVRNKYKEDFVTIVEKEVEILRSLSKDDRDKKLNIYVRDQLYKIATFCSVGRKSNDTKPTMYNKLVLHFDTNNTL